TPTFIPDSIRRPSLNDRTSTRALIAADQEVNASLDSDVPLSQVRGSRDSTTSLMWLDSPQSQLRTAESFDPTGDVDPRIVPVLLHTGAEADRKSTRLNSSH